MARSGGRLNISSRSAGGPVVSVKVTVTGVERTSDDFRAVRRNMNGALRDAQASLGERIVLPPLRVKLRAVAGDWADTLRVQRDRLDVHIGSSLPRAKNRALGWLDFGGKRPQDTRRRVGPHLIVKTLEDKQDQIRDGTYDAVLDEFRKLGFEVR